MNAGSRAAVAAVACLGLTGSWAALSLASAQTPPPATITQPDGPPPVPSPSPPPAVAARPPLIAESGDPGNVDEVVLPEKPTLALSGRSGWDNGLASLRDAFATLEAELKRLGIAPAGRPIAVFTQTADDDFRFDAMIPVAPPPDPKPAPGGEMRFAVTPSGKAYRFVHKGGYEDIDTTYETITTYLEAKDIVARDVFAEEFLNDVSDPADPSLEINIYVQPK